MAGNPVQVEAFFVPFAALILDSGKRLYLAIKQKQKSNQCTVAGRRGTKLQASLVHVQDGYLCL